MAGIGWIRLHRKVRDNPIFNDLQLFRLWIICLTEASHKAYEQPVGRQVVSLEPGQFVTGRFDLHELYNRGLKRSEKVAEYTVWRWLQSLEKQEFVSIKSHNKFSVVTVVNWDFYQSNEQENEQQNEQVVSNKRAANEQQMSTNNNVKNYKNDKNVKKKDSIPKISFAEFVKLTQEEYDKLVSEHGEERAKRIIEILDNYKGSKGKTYKSDYRAILNWVVKRLEEEEAKGGRKQSEPFGRGQATTNQYNEHHSKTSKEAVQQQSNVGSVPGTRKPIQENGDPSAPSKYDIFVR